MLIKRLSLMALILAQMACITTQVATATPEPTSQPTFIPVQFDTEPASGAVYEMPEPTRHCAEVTAIALHLRSYANENAPIITWLAQGQTVTIHAKGADWWTVQSGQFTGYARAIYLTETECE